MKWLLLAFLGTTGVVIVATCLVLLFVRGRIRRHHRVDPKVPTTAPITWLADPRGPAKLHRRLAKVGRTAGAVAADHQPARKRMRKADPPQVVTVALDLQRQAVNLDADLSRLTMLAPAARREPLLRLEAAVTELERASVQLVALSAELRTPAALVTDDDDITAVAAQVDRLAEAHQALLDIDADNGLAGSAPVTSPRTQSGTTS